MRLRIRYADGSCEEAILLVEIGSRVRVAVPDGDDALEFRKDGDTWLAESGERVEIEFDAQAGLAATGGSLDVELQIPVWPASPATVGVPLWLN